MKHSISSGDGGLMTGRLLILCLIHLLTTSVGFFIYNFCPINSNFVTVGLFLKSIGKVTTLFIECLDQGFSLGKNCLMKKLMNLLASCYPTDANNATQYHII